MKKLILLFGQIITSCAYQPSTSEPQLNKQIGDFNVIVIDSCEYIEYSSGIGNGRVYSVTHKGNCKHCKNKSNICAN
jgi:hypothetical protein